jgi:hypothetical protein
MKINKEKYLAKCREALERYEAPLKQYEADLDKWEAESQVWAEKVIKSGQLEMRFSYNGDQYFYAKGKLTLQRPKRPELERYLTDGVRSYQMQEATKLLQEVISLIEMTEGDTIGVSVANKVGRFL